MKKKLFLIFFVICALSKAGMSASMTEEDREIARLKAQMEELQQKISILEKQKAEKKQKSAFIEDSMKATSKIKSKEIQISIQDKKATAKNQNKNIDKNTKVGLALSGGGAKGAAHIGVLSALEKQNIAINGISGTSSGALVAALYSAGYSIDDIKTLMDTVDWENLFTDDIESKLIPLERKFNRFEYMVNLRYDNKLNISFPRAFRDSELTYLQLKKYLRGVEGIDNFDNLPIPLRIVATNINTGKSESFASGDLARVLAASTAVPTVFGPVEIDGNLYVDGLLSRNFPVSDAYDMGNDMVIGSNVGNELKDNSDYNIFGVINQMITIQSTAETHEQESLATILIEPDVTNYSATTNGKQSILATLGEQATLEKQSELDKLPRNTVPRVITKADADVDIHLNNIKFCGNLSEAQETVLRDMLAPIKSIDTKISELEEIIYLIYGLDFVENIYYVIKDDTLYVDAKAKPANILGLGVYYSTGYGTTLNIGTELSNIGKIGNSLYLDGQIGDYMGVKLRDFAYYGTARKFGLFTSVEANTSPFYLYTDNKKTGDFTKESVEAQFGMAGLVNNQFFVTYGISSGVYKLGSDTDTSDKSISGVEYSKNKNMTYIQFTYDRLNSMRHPTSGLKFDFNYTWGGTLGNKKSERTYYGPLYQLAGYVPVTSKATFQYGLTGGVIDGHDAFIDEYIKIGGMKDDFDSKEFAFAGYRPQQKLVEEFLMGKLGIEYKAYKNFYLGAIWNFGTFKYYNATQSVFRREKMWKDPEQGFALTAKYETLLGPIDFSLSKDGGNGNVLTQISVGYKF